MNHRNCGETKETMLVNAFLVRLSSILDDVPIALCATEDEANRLAEKINSSETIQEEIRRLLNVSALLDGNPADVVEFRNGRRLEDHWKKVIEK